MNFIIKIILVLLIVIIVYFIIRFCIFSQNTSLIQTTPILYTQTTPIKNNRDLSIKQTMSDGNCFYSSIYRSLIQKGFLNKLQTCIPKLNTLSEPEFILSFREYISVEATDDIKNMFNYFIDQINKGMDNETFMENIRYLGGITNTLLMYKNQNKFSNQYEGEFVKDIQNIIKTYKIYVGELEVSNIQKILKDCNINVKTFNNYDKAVKYISTIGNEEYNNTLFLLNLGESHWVYI